jgi:P27 family predicted phage terminase small subunit
MKYKINTENEIECQNFMKTVLKNLKTYDETWSAALHMLEENYNTFVMCSKIIKKEGLTVKDRFGVIQKHPLLKVQTDAQIQAVKLLLQFGLTLKSGSEMNADSVIDDSPLAQFLTKSNSIEKRLTKNMIND